MSTQVYPVLNGLGFPVTRSSVWSNNIQRNVSGKRVAIALWSYPLYQWELTYNYLRAAIAFGEMQTLEGFFNKRQGRFDSWLFADPDDNAVTAQAIATGDGVKSTFQLQRTFGGATMPVLAPNVLTAAKINGVTQAGVTMTVWGSATPGMITFSAPPGNGTAITADFSYYFPCEFTDDTMSFEKFLATLWSVKSVKFQSLK